MLGDAYEYLIKQFADDAGKKGGEFYTPKEVVRLMVEILEPEEGKTVYDPTCGSGGMLLEAVHYMERKGLNAQSLSLFGQEKNLNTWAICQMSLFLHGIDDAKVLRGDTLLKPLHWEESEEGVKTLRRFDLVLANPPFSLKKWGYEVWQAAEKEKQKNAGGKGSKNAKPVDPFGRMEYGMAPKGYGDLAFIQHMLASVKSSGRMAVVCPHGVLFRGGAEGKIRKGMLEDDLIEAVVGLGQNLFYGTGIPAAVLFFNRDKAPERRNKVLIVNGDKDIVPGKNQNSLSDDNIQRLSGAVRSFEDEDLFCRVVELEEIRENDHNLNLTRYVQTDPPPPPIDVEAEVLKLQELLEKRDEAEATMMNFLKELGYAK